MSGNLMENKYVRSELPDIAFRYSVYLSLAIELTLRMEDLVRETVQVLKPLLSNDPFLANMDHAKLLLHPPIRYVYDLITAISFDVPDLRRILTSLDRNRNVALKNEVSQRIFFQKIADLVKIKELNTTALPPSTSSTTGFNVGVFFKGKGAKQTNFLLQKLARMASSERGQTNQSSEVQPSSFSNARKKEMTSSKYDTEKPTAEFIGNILRPKSITFSTSTSKVLDPRKTTTAPPESEAAIPKALSACSFRQRARKPSAPSSLNPTSSTKIFPKRKTDFLPSSMDRFSAADVSLRY